MKIIDRASHEHKIFLSLVSSRFVSTGPNRDDNIFLKLFRDLDDAMMTCYETGDTRISFVVSLPFFSEIYICRDVPSPFSAVVRNTDYAVSPNCCGHNIFSRFKFFFLQKE